MNTFISEQIAPSRVALAVEGPAAMLGLIVLLLIAALVVTLAVVRLVRSRLMQMQNSLLGQLLSSLKRDIDSGEYARRLQEPVSLAGMERIYGPQIQADFPELNLEELKRRAEHLVGLTLEAISRADLSGIRTYGDLYAGQVRSYIEALRGAGQTERYERVVVHRLVLSDYRKEAGTCRILFQAATGADYLKTDPEGRTIAGGAAASQFRCDIEALYVQDSEQPHQASDLRAYALNCPNCGAPVRSLSEKTCSYCGSAIEPVNRRVWVFSDFRIAAPGA